MEKGQSMAIKKKVKQDPSKIKVKVCGVTNGVTYITTLDMVESYEEGLVKILENPWVDPKEKSKKPRVPKAPKAHKIPKIPKASKVKE